MKYTHELMTHLEEFALESDQLSEVGFKEFVLPDLERILHAADTSETERAAAENLIAQYENVFRARRDAEQGEL